MSRWVLQVYTQQHLKPEEGYWSVLVAYPEGTEMEVLLERLQACKAMAKDTQDYNKVRGVVGVRPVATKRRGHGGKPVPTYSICVSSVRLLNTETGDIIMGEIV